MCLIVGKVHADYGKKQRAKLTRQPFHHFMGSCRSSNDVVLELDNANGFLMKVPNFGGYEFHSQQCFFLALFS
jgi:hypothetical protein